MNLTYEEALKKLEEILESMENDDIQLDELLEKYKNATELHNYLTNLLNNIKSEIKLVDEENGLIDMPEMEEEV
ncbi:MAG: exodeoxyribonuclease VII small subunit [Tissierellia bacterium]|nr:exodeoxyribonuclease VII small subunit [Tissierellia bacterium]